MSPRVAVVGTSFGARIHVPALRRAGFEVAALVGRDSERTRRRAARLGAVRPCGSLAEALEVGVDAVSVAAPPAAHAPLAHEALAAGCHVLVEKPFTLDVAEAERLVHEARAAGVAAVVGHEFRWARAQSAIAWALAEGMVGEPRMVVSASFTPMLLTAAMPGWWTDPARGGGWLGASGSHRLDAVLQWVGPVSSLSATLPPVAAPDGEADDSFSLRATAGSGTEVVLVQSAADLGPPAAMTRVVGTRGRLWADGETVLLADAGSPAGRPLEVPGDLALPALDGEDVGPLAAMTRLELPPYIRLAEAFRRAVGGEPPGPGPRPATFEDGLATMRALEAARRSASLGGECTAVGMGVAA
ncbi:MAG: Gfo/Idh/MocA family protein [Acidimicrobiales bacterium]